MCCDSPFLRFVHLSRLVLSRAARSVSPSSPSKGSRWILRNGPPGSYRLFFTLVRSVSSFLFFFVVVVVDGMGAAFKNKEGLAGIKEMVRSDYFSNLSYG